MRWSPDTSVYMYRWRRETLTSVYRLDRFDPSKARHQSGPHFALYWTDTIYTHGSFLRTLPSPLAHCILLSTKRTETYSAFLAYRHERLTIIPMII